MVCIPRDGGPDAAPKMPKHDLRFLNNTFMPNPLWRERGEMILGTSPDTRGLSPYSGGKGSVDVVGDISSVLPGTSTPGDARMKRSDAPVRGTFDALGRNQLLIYARELGEHFRKERDLQHALSEREQQMRELAVASIAAQEEERQWIAFEVHDRIAQTLASVFQQLQTLESMTRDDSQARQVAVRASVLLREAIREARNIMNDLHPPVLEEFGVVPLIEEELRHLQEDAGCQTRFDSSYLVRPSWDMEVALYRIFHEALNNIRRHADSARNVTASLECSDHTVSLQIQDDGPGFDVEAAMQRKRVGGLMSMRRRAEIVGGTFEVTSTLKEGTRVTVCMPVNGNREEEQ